MKIFIRIAAIGDVIMAMTAVNRLLSRNQERILWLSGRTLAPFINRFVPGIEVLPINEARLLGTSRPAAVSEAIRTNWKVFTRSLDERCHQVGVGYHDARYRLLAIAAGFIKPDILRPTEDLYHAHQYYHLLGGELDDLRRNPLHPKELLPSTFAPASKNIAIAPGGARNIKSDDRLRRLPINKYVALAESAIDQGSRVTLMGSESDIWVRPYFQHLDVDDAIGKVPLLDVPLWLRQFSRLITHDSGPMHMGFMAGIPVTAFFGPTNSRGKVPVNADQDGSLIIQSGSHLPCAPCYNGKTYPNCDHHSCLNSADLSGALPRDHL